MIAGGVSAECSSGKRFSWTCRVADVDGFLEGLSKSE